MDIEYIKKFFEYRNGLLFWKLKPAKNILIGDEAGYIRTSDGYRSVMLNGKNYLAHRIVYALHHGCAPEYIDHIDGDRTNNVIENLRECTNAQNMTNSKGRSDNKSGVKNVNWDSGRSKWRVAIQHDGKQKHIGYFSEIDLAKAAAIEARNKYHKEFANHG